VVESPTPFVAAQVSACPAVFCVRAAAAQPALTLAMPDSGSLVVQFTVTADVYHPFVPSVPLTTGVTTGGVLSPGIFKESVTVCVTVQDALRQLESFTSTVNTMLLGPPGRYVPLMIPAGEMLSPAVARFEPTSLKLSGRVPPLTSGPLLKEFRSTL